MGSGTTCTMGGASLIDETTEGSTECWVGVRGDESAIEDCDLSERAGEAARTCVVWSGGSEVVSESMVYSDGALVVVVVFFSFFFFF